MKLLKYALYGLGGMVLIAALALGGTLILIDGAFVKARLEQAMKEKNRRLSIEGVPELRLFPVAGIALGKTTLSEPGSDKTFVTLDAAEVAVRVMPLLQREVALEALKLSGLKINVVRAKDGRMNFADLAGEEKKETPGGKPVESGEPPRIRIAGIDIADAQIAYRDEASGQEATVSGLTLKAGRLDGDAPGPVSFAARVTGKRPEIDLRAQAAGAMRFNLGRQEIGLDGFSMEVKGRHDRDDIAADLSAPKVEITPTRASGSEVKGAVQVKGPQRRADLRFRVEGIQGSAEALSLAAVALDIDAASEGNAVRGTLTTPVKGNLKARSWELPKIAAKLTFSGPAIPQKTVTLPIQAAARADLERQSASLDLGTKFDESSIQAKLGATKFTPLAATFDVTIDKLNLDRYIAADAKETKAKADERVDLSALKDKTVSGKVAIGALTAKRLKMENVKAEIKLANGKLEVAPHSVNLYGGSVSGAITADANGNRVTLRETVQGVQVGPLLRDFAQHERLQGRATVNLDVASAGASVAEMKKALGGTAKVELRDGAVKGIDFAGAFQDVKSVLGSKSAKADDPGKRTDFSEITASFAIKNGVAHNEDLQGKAPLLRIGGAGDADIGNNTVNYTARVSLVATSKGQGGKDLSQVAGVTIPVKFSGALDKPDWSVDYGELIAKSGLGKVVEKIGGAAGGAAGSVGQKIKGLFGR